MTTFVERMRALGKETIHRMCNDRHLQLCRRMRYACVKPSDSDHCGMAWHEVVMVL